MSNRLGDKSTLPSPQADDKTIALVTEIMRKKPTVQFEVLEDGNITFRFPLAGTPMTPSALRNAKLLPTRWFANAVGEYLVRINLDRLDAAVRRADYPQLAGQRRHYGFGLWISWHNLKFQFHCELINRLFNEELRWELRGVIP